MLQWSKPIMWFSSLFALVFFFWTLAEKSIPFESLTHFSFSSHYYVFLILIFFFINHITDAFIWKKILKRSSINLSIIGSLKMNWKSLLLSITTPNRVGEVFMRRLLLKKTSLKLSYQSAGIHFIFKPITFSLLFFISWLSYTYSTYFLLGFLCLMFIGYYYKVIYLDLIALNSIRILSYCIQHVFILKYLGVSAFLHELFVVVNIHSSGALIPHLFGTEILIKLSLFELSSQQWTSWNVFTISLLILWLMNILVPSLIALSFKTYD